MKATLRFRAGGERSVEADDFAVTERIVSWTEWSTDQAGLRHVLPLTALVEVKYEVTSATPVAVV
jgi:hypothetical protein